MFVPLNPNYLVDVTCVVLNKITCKLPQVQINVSALQLPENITLADPKFFNPSNIDMLLGADVYYSILLDGLMQLGPNLPVLQNSHLVPFHVSQ